MKVRFTTVDIIAILRELREKVLGMRVVNVYDVDHKTYIIKIARSEEKAFIIFESGVRIHLTEFEWPKNMMPSGFSMKCRKHLKSRRLVAIDQLGVDRIIDMQFGSEEAAYHLIVELYDKGNVILTDYQYVILSLLRTRTDQEVETRFAVREVYPKDAARQNEPLPSFTRLQEILSSHSAGDQLRRVLMPHFVYGAALLDHVLLGAGFDEGALIGDIADTLPRLQRALEEAERIFQQLSVEQYQSCIIQRKHNKEVDHAASAVESPDLVINVEFHPIIYRHHEKLLFTTYQSFNKAVDEFFSKLNIQKIDVKLHQQEKAGLKKLENVRKDHSRRLQELERVQSEDCSKAELIELNIELVTKACDVINGAIASAMDWGDIVAMVKEARSHGDTVACAIHELQLERNHMIMLLCNPYDNDDDDKGKAVKVDIDLDLTAHANVRRYFDHKRFAVTKQQKTIDASSKALKSAEKKTKQALKEASKVATIKKARKVYWFEKFYWFISSENYLVIGGRDQQQNELIVKRYLTEGDVYMHVDLHGASSIVIKNPSKQLVSSCTLSEAATMATCYSSAWEAKVTSNVWWVWHHQVSKTAPSGEYLTTGSFMIRGKKNYLPPSQLMLCFGFMFKLDEDSVSNHHGDRRVKTDDSVSMSSEVTDAAMEIVAIESDDSSDNDLIAENNSIVSMVTFPDTIIGLTSSHDYRPAGRGVKEKVSLEPRDERKTTKNKPPNKEGVDDKQRQSVKRGQKYKQRKMRERYKDQDEEDRQLRMQLLASAGDVDKHSGGKNKKKNDKKSRNAATAQKHKYPRAKESSDNNLVEVTNKQQDPILIATTLASPDLHQSSEILDHVISEQERVSSKQDHLNSEQDHMISEQDHMTLEQDHMTLEQDHMTSEQPSEQDYMISEQYHMLPEQDHTISEQDHATSGQDHVTSQQDHVISQQDHVISGPDQVTSGPDHVTSGQDHKTVVDSQQCNDQDDDQTDQDDDDDDVKDDITSLLNTLTGCPSNDDILLFAVPVCAPYLAMTQYKYKVKIIPGMQKRGKAARTALHNFIRSREVSGHEKDLLLSVKDNDLSRYFPGKVKLLATSNQSGTTKHK